MGQVKSNIYVSHQKMATTHPRETDKRGRTYGWRRSDCRAASHHAPPSHVLSWSLCLEKEVATEDFRFLCVGWFITSSGPQNSRRRNLRGQLNKKAALVALSQVQTADHIHLGSTRETLSSGAKVCKALPGTLTLLTRVYKALSWAPYFRHCLIQVWMVQSLRYQQLGLCRNLNKTQDEIILNLLNVKSLKC